MAAPNWMQETGLTNGLAPAGPANGTAVKALGAGLAVIWSTMQASISSVLPWAVFGLWAMWMILGFARAMSNGEKFCANKAMGGAWKLVGAGAIWIAAVMGEAILSEQGQSIPLAAGALGFIAVNFSIKAADAASHFFPGLRTVLEKAAPQLFTPKPDKPPLAVIRNEEAS
jgi:hypothetical protein